MDYKGVNVLTMSKDYSNEPISITAAKAEREHNSTLWTPRDALIDTLRRLDKGEITPTRIVIAFREGEPDAPYTSYAISGHDPLQHVGMLERVKMMILDPD